jgi:hypothetical protein
VYADFGIPACWIAVPIPIGRPAEIVPADLVSGSWRRGPGGR